MRPMTTMQQETNPRMVTFKMSEADHAELEMLARESERTLSAEIRLAIRAWLTASRQS